MFQNLSFAGFTWRREPALYVALLVAIGNVALSWLDGGLAAGDALESAVALVSGFLIRGRVSPA